MPKEKLPRTLIKLELKNTEEWKTPPTYSLINGFNSSGERMSEQKEQVLHKQSNFISVFIPT